MFPFSFAYSSTNPLHFFGRAAAGEKGEAFFQSKYVEIVLYLPVRDAVIPKSAMTPARRLATAKEVWGAETKEQAERNGLFLINK